VSIDIYLSRHVVVLFTMSVSNLFFFFFSSRRRHTRWPRDWSSDVCSSDLNRLDLQPQAIERVPMDPGQEPTLAPLELGVAGREVPPQHESFVLDRAEREIDVPNRDAERRRDGRRRGRPRHFESPTHQLAERIFPTPRPGAIPLRHDVRRLTLSAGERGLEQREPFSGEPELGLVEQRSGPPGL